MKNYKTLNAGTGMALGVLVSTLIALLIQLTTGDSTIWSWVIPVGLATGLAIGAGHEASKKEDMS